MIPYSVARGHIRHQMQKRAQMAQLQAQRGEKMISAMIPGRGYSWQNRTQDRWTQIQHMKNWTGVCIDKLASLCAQLVPNIGRVFPQKNPNGNTQKWFTHDYGRMQDLGSYAGRSFTSGTYQRKALSGVKPHEEVEPVEWNHPLRRLIENPNDWDTQFTHDYDIILYLLLTGVSYDWAVPHEFYDSNSLFPGIPKELWTIPSPWVWPIGGNGEVVSKDHPFADRLVAYYELRPYGGAGGGGIMRIPPNQMICYRYPSPISKVDGWAKTQLGAEWIDADDSISKSQRAQMTNGGFPSFWLKLPENMEDPSDDAIARVEAKFRARHMGENRMGYPFIGAPGVEPVPLEFPPLQMAYGEAQDQSRDRIVALFGLSLALLGLTDNQTFGSVLANLMSVCQNTVKPLLTMIGQTKTKFLASKFAQADGPLRVWYDDPTPIDPQQLNLDLETDAKNGWITPNEARQIRNRLPYKHGGDDPLVPGPGGLIPLPLGTGEDLSGLAELMPLLGRQDNPAAQEEEAQQGTGGKIDEPNGPPQKRFKSEQAHVPPGTPEGGQFAPKNGVPSGGASKPSARDLVDYSGSNYDKHPLNAAVLGADTALRRSFLEDPAKAGEMVQACIETSMTRNREALADVPDDKRAFLESWMNRQAKLLDKPAADLLDKVQSLRAVHEESTAHDKTEPDEPEAPDDPTDEEQEAFDAKYEEWDAAHEVWSDKKDDLEAKYDKLDNKTNDARERFLDKLDAFNFAFADRVLEQLQGKPKKSWAQRRKSWNEANHPRGQPDNPGQFAEGPASGLPQTSTSEMPALIQDAAPKLNEITKPWIASLSDKYKDAIKTYTAEGTYKELNSSMRSCPPEFKCLDNTSREIVENIEKAIAESPEWPGSATVMRGMVVDKKTATRLISSMKKQKEFALPSLTSTSVNASAFNFLEDAGEADSKVLFIIRAKKGLFVTGDLTNTPNEQEVILSSKARFKFDDTETHKGIKKVWLEQVA
jgi:portal protein/ADP-ribosyltransferase exoenzyme